MSRCYNCSENFGIFKRPVTCGNCNFAFCSKCCNEKINVPKKENKLLVVCSKCKNVIKNGGKNETSDDALPKNFLKLVETNRSKTNTASANVASNQAPNQGGYQDLANRLEILKNTDKPAVIPSDKEMEERLLKLTFGNNPPQQRSQLSNLPVEDKIKTSDDLISKLKDEAELDKKYEEYEKSELEKLENRLRKLDAGTEKKSDPIIPDKGGEAKKSVIDTDIDLDDDEKTEKLVEQLLKEIKVNDDDEDAWCCMCNKDADLRCIDCENDFYCNKCFKKIHVAFEYKTHRKEAIKK